nr:hypothetical protein [Lysobacter enzymogenes]
MRTITRLRARNAARAAVLLSAVSVFPAFAAQPLFVADAPATRASLAGAQSAAVAGANRLAAAPATMSLQLKRADAAVVSKATREIELRLGSRLVDAVLDSARDTGDGATVWLGHLKENAKSVGHDAREVRRDERNSVALVRRGDGVTGNVRVDGRLYRIRPLADGTHAVVEVDESRMPPDHPQGYRDSDLPQIDMRAASRARSPRSVPPRSIPARPRPSACRWSPPTRR